MTVETPRSRLKKVMEENRTRQLGDLGRQLKNGFTVIERLIKSYDQVDLPDTPNFDDVRRSIIGASYFLTTGHLIDSAMIDADTETIENLEAAERILKGDEHERRVTGIDR